MNKFELIDSLLSQANALQPRDENAVDAILKRADMILRRVTGERSPYIASLHNIDFWPRVAPASGSMKHEAWVAGRNELLNLLRTVKEELELCGTSEQTEVNSANSNPANVSNPQSVFVVHGHDEELKQAVARTIEKFGLEAIILHERPNKGRTIIEKFADYGDVGFAVVLLSADDTAYAENVDGQQVSYRARQNVILELGFFLGRIGRERVAAIYRPHEHFEMPSDYAGVLFIEYDAAGAWRNQLAKELKASGFEINLDAILE